MGGTVNKCCTSSGGELHKETVVTYSDDMDASDQLIAQAKAQTQPLEAGISGTEFDIPEDAYGAAILAIVKDRGTIAEGKATQLIWMRFIFPLILLAVNLGLQIMLVTFIFTHVVQPAVSNVQDQYKAFHEEVFDANGNFLAEEWADWPGRTAICEIALSNRVFLYSVLFIWVVRMMQELRTSQRFFSNVHEMPTCRIAREMLQETGSVHHIVALTPLTRCLLYALVCIPKLVISIVLLCLGCRFLSATNNFENLVMNTVALEFVLHIDETLFDACIPAAYRKQVADVNFFLQDAPEEGLEKRKEYEAFMRSFFYVGLSVFCVWLYAFLFQNVLPRNLSDISAHCGAYVSEERAPLCNKLWNIDDCYPFGPQGVISTPPPSR